MYFFSVHYQGGNYECEEAMNKMLLVIEKKYDKNMIK